MNALANWTNTWFIRPSTCERPSADECLWVFMALTSLLGPDTQEDDFRYVHAYFTYLLLKCDPVTNATFNDSDEGSENDIMVNVDRDWKRTFERLLDFTNPRDPVPRWNLLLMYSRLDPKTLIRQTTDKLAIKRACLTIALVLLRKPVLPDVLVFVKMCLDLYQRHLDYSVATKMSTEFCSSGPLFLAVWISNAIDQAFAIGTMSLEKILSTISYVAWFANLVRAERSLKVWGKSQRARDVVSSILKKQVADLKDVLHRSPLKIEHIVPSTHLLDVFGIRPKKKVK